MRSKGGSAAVARAPGANPRQALLGAGVAKAVVQYGREEIIFRQGDPCDHVMYIQSGGVKLSVLSKTGRAAVVAVLGPGDFFGEGCLAAQPLHRGSATAITPSAILVIKKGTMIRLLRKRHAMSDQFISHLLVRHIRIQEDLIDQLFNSSEKRLAGALLRLARYGTRDKPIRVVPKVSRATLAQRIGTTRSRVDFLLNKFKKLGFIEYNGQIPLKINNSLLNVVLHD